MSTLQSGMVSMFSFFRETETMSVIHDKLLKKSLLLTKMTQAARAQCFHMGMAYIISEKLQYKMVSLVCIWASPLLSFKTRCEISASFDKLFSNLTKQFLLFKRHINEHCDTMIGKSIFGEH